MITLQEPHMGLNAEQNTKHVDMRVTRVVPRYQPAAEILDSVVAAASAIEGGRFRNLVFRCHGSPAHLFIGTGIGANHTNLFRRLRGKVDKIWFHACRVARSTPGAHLRKDGHRFCSRVAVVANCYVVASTERQVISRDYQLRSLPYGQIDSFEGLVLTYDRSGRVSRSRRFPSTYRRSAQEFARNPD